MRILASQIDKMFMLKSIQPFNHLDERTLFNISEVMHLTRYEAGAEVVKANEETHEVIISLDGELFDYNGNSVRIAGIYSILSDTPVTIGLVAGDNGCQCLRIGKGHFLTTIYECPILLTEMIQLRNINPHYYV